MSREKFEAWAKGWERDLTRMVHYPDEYWDYETQLAWEAWEDASIQKDELVKELVEALEDIVENCYFGKKDIHNPRNINEYRTGAKAVLAKMENGNG